MSAQFNVNDFVRSELAEVNTGKKPLLSEPQDVVLYGFGRIGRLLARILVDKAGGATFVPLQEGIETLQPFACCLVGMGEDGHFASVFPDSPQLQEALSSESGVIQVTTPSSPHVRVTMTLTALARAYEIILLVFGERKRQILSEPQGFVVNHLLQAASVEVVWAP